MLSDIILVYYAESSGFVNDLGLLQLPGWVYLSSTGQKVGHHSPTPLFTKRAT